jgi:hypothetical protein
MSNFNDAIEVINQVIFDYLPHILKILNENK